MMWLCFWCCQRLTSCWLSFAGTTRTNGVDECWSTWTTSSNIIIIHFDVCNTQRYLYRVWKGLLLISVIFLRFIHLNGANDIIVEVLSWLLTQTCYSCQNLQNLPDRYSHDMLSENDVQVNSSAFLLKFCGSCDKWK